MVEKPTFLIKIFDEADPSCFGIGEASVFPGLSPEADGNYVLKLTELMANVAIGKSTDLSRYSSIQFGLEQAILDFSNGCRGIYYPGEFTKGKQEIEINGLIWMGTYREMMERIEIKMKEGFRCMKLKIGAIGWEEELEMLRHIRKRFSKEELIVRVDANGAFTPQECLPKLYELAKFDIHSIEQPIKAGNPEAMAKLCKETPVPIALDEELIGKPSSQDRISLLESIKPQYIVLKPSLCGGFSGAMEWIREAKNRNIGWWITSALESNVGLNAIAQWTATLPCEGAQGLGTGALFNNNFSTPITLHKDTLKYNPQEIINYDQFSGLKWHS